eukprot:TRINITY_DN14402_c0_g1_i1.p1 TRINITY_DN14402_c0_g1~~TRINITY_DN14402_c0_g1_i1.p1  ORF type:complete len:877 (-),score=239.38 TRINITY_DN14402_c0_g1_i1:38-2668(-)
MGTSASILNPVVVPLVEYPEKQPSIGARVRHPTQKDVHRRIGKKMAAAGFVPKYPIVLMPGFLSSVLRVEHSDHSSDWIGERVWLSLGKIGGEKLKHIISKPYTMVANVFSDEETRFRNQWMEHVTLQKDCRSDPDGVRVRAMAGNDGVTFLAPGPFTNALSYVMGPLIRTLTDFGYTEDNLVAAPYDWRVPLPFLEERDGYFSKVQALIEELSTKHKSPVAVLAHSMGNRTFQYFLNWVKRKPNGQQWIDTHVYSFIAVGAPWLGAPKTVRGYITGERFGLEPFMTEKQSISWARCMGSLMSLIPYKPELYFGDQMRLVYTKRDDGAWVGLTYPDSFHEAGCGHLLDLYKDYYLSDECFGGADGEAILQPPPVKRLYAIYGVNMDTELFYLYKKSSNGTLHLGSAPSAAFGGDYKIEAGIGHETEKTKQPIIKLLTGEEGRRSGDGSVPYASLNYCALWKDDIEYLKIDELERVDHRHILSNRLFFQRIIEYVSERRVAEPPAAPIVQLNIRHLEVEERNGHRFSNTWLRAVSRRAMPPGSGSNQSTSKDEFSDEDASSRSESVDLSDFSSRSATPMDVTYIGTTNDATPLGVTPTEVSATLAHLLADLASRQNGPGDAGDGTPPAARHRGASDNTTPPAGTPGVPTPVSVTPRTASLHTTSSPYSVTPILMVTAAGRAAVVDTPDGDTEPETTVSCEDFSESTAGSLRSSTGMTRDGSIGELSNCHRVSVSVSLSLSMSGSSSPAPGSPRSFRSMRSPRASISHHRVGAHSPVSSEPMRRRAASEHAREPPLAAAAAGTGNEDAHLLVVPADFGLGQRRVSRDHTLLPPLSLSLPPLSPSLPLLPLSPSLPSLPPSLSSDDLLSDENSGLSRTT